MSQPTPLQDRVERERQAHQVDDVLAQAQALKDRFSHVVQTPAYLEMEARQAALIEQMRDADVLDYGCGRGQMSLQYLRAGARQVSGIDISATYVAEAAERCRQAGFPPERFHFQVMDAHALTYANDSFDWVIGRGILHHLDLSTAMDEIRRVLRPGGHAVFLEPLADNPLLRLFRALTPAARTRDERPLTRADLITITAHMHTETLFFGMLSTPAAMLTSILMPRSPDNLIIGLADRLERVLRRRHWLDRHHQYALLILRRH